MVKIDLYVHCPLLVIFFTFIYIFFKKYFYRKKVGFWPFLYIHFQKPLIFLGLSVCTNENFWPNPIFKSGQKPRKSGQNCTDTIFFTFFYVHTNAKSPEKVGKSPVLKIKSGQNLYRRTYNYSDFARSSL